MRIFNPEFDIPDMSRDTSSYSDLKPRIFNAVRQLNHPSQRELHEFTQIPCHLIPDRLLQLILEKKVKQSGSKLDPITNKTVTTYNAVV